MARILCIETATEICSVSLAVDGKAAYTLELNEGYTHAAKITLLIQELMEKSALTLSQLDAVAVSMGPGSYTGLRVGVSTAKGLCYALKKPLIAVNTLTALTSEFVSQHPTLPGSLVVPMIDARRMEVFCSVMDTVLHEIEPTQAMIINEESFASLFSQHNVYFIGNGAAKCKPVLTHSNAIFIDGIHCSARGLAAWAEGKFHQQTFEDIAYFEPFYLKDFVGTTPRIR